MTATAQPMPQAVITLAGLKVYCGYAGGVDPRTLQQHPLNPNTHPPEQVEAYLEVIRGNGWRRPITVSARSGFITKGHGAYLAAILGQLALVPVEYQDYEDEAAELADLVADNRLSELSKRDKRRLTEVLLRLDTGEFDMRRAGYLQDELEDLMTKTGHFPEPEGPRVGSASDESNIPISSVRMLQLYLSDETLPAFLQMVEDLKVKYHADNVTDTIVAIVKEVHGAWQRATT